ncbi:Nin one binding Zn-ribbon like-domain-containing protein [Zychaea mexicana]|uniref:Nin one binding Zn-ribbon like-domain-containing protein n=1 Tax=Zychaea mexicana TaxID=64656 RepID=UPI0022FDF034|nr:Nin one binding Zn-ribbon like-domain-containing protein [Zychaea mexicana]KAI9499178.1 Nin one binding Zn-ribbon like-domain-containing protein [Zychaea mexicana]
MASSTSSFGEPRINQLIVDTNAIVNGTTLQRTANEFYTCPEVITEVRSAHSREYLTRLPFEIQIEDPTEDAMKAVVEFSKKTGDYASLSLPDLKVLALTYTLEARANGIDGIRKEPVKTRPTGTLPSAPPPKPKKNAPVVEDTVDDDGWETATTKKKGRHFNNKKKAQPQQLQPQKQEEPPVSEPTTTTTTTTANEAQQNDNTTYEVSNDNTTAVSQQLENMSVNEPAVTEQLVEDEDDSDCGEWITPDNIEDFKATELGVTPEELKKQNTMAVACMTGDFAMQNVLLQMNMNLVSTGGHRITRVKNWVLRCHACFTVTTNMEKKFCPKCGNASLQRVSCSTNGQGHVTYHLKKNYQYNLRGTKYDIPRPQGGRQINNIVLREDQREYVKSQQNRSKKGVLDMFDPDFIPLSNKTGGDGRFVGNNMYGSDTIGFGRRNPNASRRGRRK